MIKCNTIGKSFVAKEGKKKTRPMSVTHPELASEFHPTKNRGICTSDLTAGSGRKLWWLCSDCAHEWLARGYSRASGGGCPACSNKAIHIDGRNSMASTHPDLAKEFHPTRNGELTPRDVVAGTGRKLWWRCLECEHEWNKPGSRRVRGIGCPACSNKAIHIDGRNSMALTFPLLAI